MTREEIHGGIAAVLESLDPVLDRFESQGIDVSETRDLSREITDEIASKGSQRLLLAM